MISTCLLIDGIRFLSRFFVDDRYARNTFFDHVGELNDVIIMYNQATRSANNLNGCWDWYGLHDNGDVGRYGE